MRHLVLAQSDCTASALCAWLELLGEEPPKNGDPSRIVVASPSGAGDRGLEKYHSVVRHIQAAIPPDPLCQHGDVIVLVDCISPAQLSAIAEGMEWNHLVALLTLTFPEVKWMFGIVTGELEDFPREDHTLPALLTKARRDPLFDPTGLREWVRQKTNEKLNDLHKAGGGTGLALQLPKRRKENLAAAIDDEVDYARVHAYTAYRYGYRGDVITTWSLMDERFGEKRAELLPPDESHGYALLLEDMRLTFADKPGRTHLSRLDSRAVHCPLLKNGREHSNCRCLITTGQMGQDDELVEDNKRYLEDKNPGHGSVHFKPLGGLCDIWSKIRLRDSGILEGSPRGNGQGFQWPPEKALDDLHDGHGSPGKLGMVARVLIERATAMRQTASSAGDWIHAAVLAGDAAELLGGKTPTLTLAALALKHEYEVRGECTFIGAGFHFGLDQRIKEIKAEVASVKRWFYPKIRESAAHDATATILNRLKLAFSEAGQMEEEERCLIELRSINRKMSRPKGWWWISPPHLLAHIVLSYGEWLLGSFARLIMMSAFWLGGIGFLAHKQLNLAQQQLEGGSWPHQSISIVVGWFFGGNAASDPANDPLLVSIHILSWIAVPLGVFHLGILMSYLYSLISRK